MKSKIFLAAFLTLIYLAEATKFDLIILVGKNHAEKITGKLNITLYGAEHNQKYTFLQTEFEHPVQGVPGTIDFPEDDIQKVDVTWNSDNDFEIQVNVLIVEDGFTIQTFKPENGFEINIPKGNTATLMKYF